MKDTFISARERIRSSATAKVFFMGFLILILMIPTQMVSALIRSREFSMSSAAKEVTQKWGGEQTLSGPILSIPYMKWKNANKSDSNQVGYLHLLPEVLYVNATVNPEVRSRGIFDIPLYASDLKISGSFSTDELNFPVTDDLVLWNDAKLVLGISDMRGIKEQVKISFDHDETLTMNSGLSRYDVLPSGVQATVSGLRRAQEHTFETDLRLNGGQAIYFNPMGRETQVKMTSNWPNPSFDGAFLPTEHQITDQGFEARWSVLDINRNFPQQWTTSQVNSFDINSSRFGLKLFMPVDVYQQTTRSVKYALLFIVLTFLAFFLPEVLNNLRIHPIQYLLVGFAIVLFYLLLLSLSEHIDFKAAYIIASAGIVAMISLYSVSVLRNGKLAGMIGTLMALLYVFLYFLLQMEDLALLLGSIGLFIILGAVMFLTRNMDWYAMKNRD